MSANMTHVNLEASTSHGNSTSFRGRGHFYQGKGFGRWHFTLTNKPIYQLYGKLGHYETSCWHIYDEAFNLYNYQSRLVVNQHEKESKHEGSKS